MAVDPRRAEAGARRVGAALDRTGVRADRLRGLITRAFSGITAILGGASVIRTLANFEQQMSTVRAITQATDDQFNELADTARRLGGTTRFTASQAAEGMLFLARAGFETNDVLASIEGTLQLAQAGALDLGRAADIASNVLTGFRLETSQTARVVDVLALAANSANTTVGQLGEALKFVAPVAAGLGVDIETATAAVSALSDAGLQGTLAGTGLRRVLSELESPSQKTIELLNNMGLSADQVRVSQVGLVAALQALKQAGIDTGLALEIFGDRGGPAFEVLSSSIPKLIAFEESLRDAGGTAERVADIMDDNLNGALLRVASAFESIILAFGQLGGSSVLTGAFDRLAALLRVMADNVDLVTIAAGSAGAALLLMVSPLILSGIRAIVASLTALAARTLPLLTGAAIAAFGTLAAIAVAEGRTIQDVVAEIQARIEDLYTSISEPHETVNDFSTAIRDIAGQIERLGGAARLSVGETENFVERLKTLRDEIESRLDLQLTLFPSSEAVELFQLQIEAIDALLSRLGATAEEAAVALEDEAGAVEANSDALGRLREEVRTLLRLRTMEVSERAVALEMFEAEQALAEENVTLSEAQQEQLRVLLTLRARTQQALSDEAAAYQALQDPAKRYLDRLIAIDNVLQYHPELTDRAARAQEDLRVEFLRTQDTMAAGFELATIEMNRDLDDFAGKAERAFRKTFEGATDAIVEFVTTGKLEVDDMVSSIIASLARLAVEQTITGPLFNAFSGVLGNIFSPASVGAPSPGLPGFGAAGGGLIHGPGSGTSDSILARLSNGEFVVNARATARHLDTLRKINASIPAFQSGGYVGQAPAPGGTVVQVYDQRTVSSQSEQPVEVEQRRSADGGEVIRILIRKETRSMIEDGELDAPMRRRFGTPPLLA